MEDFIKGCKTYREHGICKCNYYNKEFSKEVKLKIANAIERNEGYCPCHQEGVEKENTKCLGWEDTKKELEEDVV